MVSSANVGWEKIVIFVLIDGIIKSVVAKKIITVYNSTSMVCLRYYEIFLGKEKNYPLL